MYNLKNDFIYFCGLCLGLCCYADFSLVVVSGGYSAVGGVQASPCGASQVRGLRNCGSQALEHRLNTYGPWALLLHGMWDLPRSVI